VNHPSFEILAGTNGIMKCMPIGVHLTAFWEVANIWDCEWRNSGRLGFFIPLVNLQFYSLEYNQTVLRSFNILLKADIISTIVLSLYRTTLHSLMYSAIHLETSHDPWMTILMCEHVVAKGY
jgi:hypothetical protein